MDDIREEIAKEVNETQDNVTFTAKEAEPYILVTQDIGMASALVRLHVQAGKNRDGTLDKIHKAIALAEAAPDLLEALENILAWSCQLQHDPDKPGYIDGTQLEFNDIRAVIAKARGE